VPPVNTPLLTKTRLAWVKNGSSTLGVVARMNIEYELSAGVATLTLTGELDTVSAPWLLKMAETALNEPVEVLRINLAAVTFMDSTGLGALVTIKNRVDSSRHILVLEQPASAALTVAEDDSADQILRRRMNSRLRPAAAGSDQVRPAGLAPAPTWLRSMMSR
jgi:anti-sigma B factor antagonist